MVDCLLCLNYHYVFNFDSSILVIGDGLFSMDVLSFCFVSVVSVSLCLRISGVQSERYSLVFVIFDALGDVIVSIISVIRASLIVIFGMRICSIDIYCLFHVAFPSSMMLV